MWGYWMNKVANSQAMHKRHGWGTGLIEIIEGDNAYISVVFSWLLEKAIARYIELLAQGYNVELGGTAAQYAGIATSSNGHRDFAQYHNPNATRTSTGCIFNCDFCIVSKIEGYLKEKPHWEPKPIVYDNCLNACSNRHFDKVIDSLKPIPNIDLNQGVSAVLMTNHHASRFAELDLKYIRLAWDTIEYESKFMRGYEILRKAGIPKSKIGVYVLIGFKDTPEDALYRLETVKNLGVLPFPMRYQPLDTQKRNSFVGEHWTHNELVRYCRYWSNLRFVRGIPFKNFVYPSPPKGKQHD
jgi:hypothetical protein